MQTDNTSTRILAISSILLSACFACKPAGFLDPTQVSESNIAAVAAFLSSDEMGGRESGTEFAKKTSDYIRKIYMDLGLAPAFTQGYTQEFPFIAGTKQTVASVKMGENGHEIQGTVLPIVQPGETTGTLVFGKHCIESDEPALHDLSKLELKGKILVCLRYGPNGKNDPPLGKAMGFLSKLQNAEKQSASGIIFVGDSDEDISPDDLPLRRAKGPIAIFLKASVADRAFPWLVDFKKNRTAAGENIPACDDGCKITLTTGFEPRNRTGFNVGAFLRPYKPGQRYMIIGAHFDHLGLGNFSSMGSRGQIHNGADDNASGTSAVLELSRLFAAREKAGKPIPETHNILFLNFDAEERGLFGSLAYTRDPPVPLADALGMINLDMVGRLRADKGLNLQGKDTGDERLLKIMEESFAKTGFESTRLKLISGGGGPSDHASFYMANLPVAFIFTGYHMQYHKPEDDFALLNISGIARVVQFTASLTDDWLAQNPPIAFRQAPETSESKQYELKVRLGIMPGNYDSASDGLIVGGIHKGAPIEKTGIRQGDRIVQLGTTKIRDIHDLMEFLSNASTRTVYKMIYVRGNQRIESQTELMGE
ncbi:MAG: M28 family peptidase [Spirochaetia bacterium]|nr:M28 family peptidase [Spirochaetia bacterium]